LKVSLTLTSAFGADWNNTYCSGLIKKHNGTDFSAAAGTAVYAAEDGVVRNADFVAPWAYRIVLEHNHPQGGKYTTVYWHVTPSVAVDNFVPKGMQIATVANLGSNTHFHFGVRLGVYDVNVSGTGSLPQTICGGYPAFPENFIDPNNVNNVLFQ
jgi:murein DD-endopeptidase MepM/ murein hydrolase activator NlpD